MISNKPKPIAQGNFSKTPFAHILVYILTKELHGTLEVRDGARAISIYFRNGCPAKVQSTEPGMRLGEVLEQMGKLTPKQIQESLEEVKRTGELHGQALVRMGFVDGATLVAGITEQMIFKMITAFTFSTGEYAFYEGINLITKGPSELVSLDTLTLLMVGIRKYGPKLNLAPYLASLADKSFYVNDVEPLRKLRLDANERLICRKLLESPQDLMSLKKWDAVDVHVLQGVLYVLLITKTLKVISKEEVASSRVQLPQITLDSMPPEPEKSSYPPEVQAMRDEIQKRAALISSQNYYEMLGIERNAGNADIRKAFFKLAKNFHPDRSAKPGLEDLREALAYLFANLSEAHSTLNDIDSKGMYDASLSDTRTSPNSAGNVESDEEAEVRRIIEADRMYQKALVLMRQQKNTDALNLVEQAFDNCPEEAEYIATRAYLKMLLGKEKPEDLITVFREAERTNPKSERIHFYFAQVLKNAGRTNEAKKHFKEAATINPRNIEAAREVRIIEMRSKNTGKNKKPGFLDKFRK
ncbi:MAG: DnaJ domain-containing protein [Deltaproteobacteria bacterium]|nr:DnaJ domain-containing protein [Deltaproteobacteria bacterium]MBN2671451.1 DnaJ domain-containing protein [Deltaproteobacteria bacterium]